MLESSSTRSRARLARPDLAFGLLLLLSVWCVILLGRVVEDATGEASWIAVSFAGAGLLVLSRRRTLDLELHPASMLLGFLSGFAGFSSWVATVWIIGSSLGLPAGEAEATLAPWPLWAALVLLAPLFEEILYRGHILSLVRNELGRTAALVLSSTLFSISHVQEWSALNTFLAGLLLGGVRLAGGPIPLCIAMHAGFNLATLVCGVPPERFVLTPTWSSGIGGGALLLALWIVRRLNQGKKS